MRNLELFTPNQQKAIVHDKGNMLVSASAGSGKTMVVINRIIYLITQKNVDIDRILAVTFTNAAAQEMKEKLKKALVDEFNETGDLFLKKQLDKVNTANISTIHSFCGNLLKKYFYAIGLDASFKLIDEKESEKLAFEALNNLFDKLYEEKNEEFFDVLTFLTKKRNDKSLRSTLIKLYKFLDGEEDIDSIYSLSKNSHENAYDIYKSKLFRDVKFSLNIILEGLKEAFLLLNEDTKRLTYCESLSNLTKNCLQINTLEEFANTAEDFAFKAPSSTIVNNEGAAKLKNANAQFKNVVKEVSEFLGKDKKHEELKLKKGWELTQKLFSLVKKFKSEFLSLKTENNVVDFNDLQKFTLKLFESESILNEIKNHYEYIFVDEYQDVNSLQENLILKLSSNNLFMVGDSKQSIYAFRGCNPKFFVDKYKNYMQNIGGEALSLDDNFRSAPNIIKTVNNVFADVFTEDFCNLNYSKNPMIYGKLYGDYQGKAVYHIIEKVKKQNPVSENNGVYSVIDNFKQKNQNEYSKETVLLINLINDIVGKTYYDIKEKNENKIKEYTFGDICLLFRSDSSLAKEVRKALIDCNIPLSSNGKINIFEYPEVKVMQSLVSALCSFWQDIPLATIMINLWGFDEDELSLIRKNSSGKLDFYMAVKECAKSENILATKIQNFLVEFEKYRTLSEFLSANELLTRIVSEKEWEAKLLSSPYGKDRLKRIERFIAESIIGDNKMSIREFDEYLSRLEELTIVESTGENTVKMMTEHSSKGLEFPCVIIMGAGSQYSQQDLTNEVFMDRNFGIATKIYDQENMTVEDNLVMDIIKRDYKINRAVEEARVLYVAMTRAKCELHVITNTDDLSKRQYSTFVKANSPSEFLSETDAETIYYSEDDLFINKVTDSTFVAGNKISPQLTKLIKENLSYNYNYQTDTYMPLKASVSQLNNDSEEEYATISIFGNSSAEKGTAYHKFLQVCDFSNHDVKKEIQKVINSGELSASQIELLDENKLEKILNMDIFKKFNEYQLFKERKFYCLVEGSMLGYENSLEKVLVQGIIDLMAQKDDEIILIDYKLSTIEKDLDIISKYQTQMILYKYAIEKITNKKVKKVYIINILQEKVIEINV